MNCAIETFDLTKVFRGTPVVDGLSFVVPEGSIYGLVGPNGAGKTTTIKTLMNILRPDGGRGNVLCTDTRHLGPRDFAQIGYVSENQELPEWMTVRYFLHYLAPFYPTWDKELERELLRQFQLPLDQKLKHLSRGMRMKAALASSLAYRPRLIVLDEPFSGLDPLVRDEFIESLLARAEGTTIFISSHDLGEMESFASHIGYLDAGKLRISEELDSLSSRFREVVLTFDSPPQRPRELPADWLQFEVAGNMVRFVEARYDERTLGEQTRSVFPEYREIQVNGMPLRSIYVALAKKGREA